MYTYQRCSYYLCNLYMFVFYRIIHMKLNRCILSEFSYFFIVFQSILTGIGHISLLSI